LGDFADRFKYELKVSIWKNDDVKQRNIPSFTPALPGETGDFGDVVLEGEIAAK